MSLILDALRKSDAQRSRQQAPQVAGAAAAAEPTPQNRWLVPALVLLGVNALMLAIVLLRPDSPTTEPADAAATQPTTAVTSPAATQTAAQAAAAPPVTTGNVTTPAPRKAEVRSLIEASSTRRPATVTPMQARGTPRDTSENTPAQALAVEPAAESRAPDANSNESLDLPDAGELIDGGVIGREALTLELHYYADPADRRFAFIGGQRVRGGDVLSGGIGIVDVVRNGVVLEHRGRRYLLRRN